MRKRGGQYCEERKRAVRQGEKEVSMLKKGRRQYRDERKRAVW